MLRLSQIKRDLVYRQCTVRIGDEARVEKILSGKDFKSLSEKLFVSLVGLAAHQQQRRRSRSASPGGGRRPYGGKGSRGGSKRGARGGRGRGRELGVHQQGISGYGNRGRTAVGSGGGYGSRGRGGGGRGTGRGRGKSRGGTGGGKHFSKKFADDSSSYSPSPPKKGRKVPRLSVKVDNGLAVLRDISHTSRIKREKAEHEPGALAEDTLADLQLNRAIFASYGTRGKEEEPGSQASRSTVVHEHEQDKNPDREDIPLIEGVRLDSPRIGVGLPLSLNDTFSDVGEEATAEEPSKSDETGTPVVESDNEPRTQPCDSAPRPECEKQADNRPESEIRSEKADTSAINQIEETQVDAENVLETVGVEKSDGEGEANFNTKESSEEPSVAKEADIASKTAPENSTSSSIWITTGSESLQQELSKKPSESVTKEGTEGDPSADKEGETGEFIQGRAPLEESQIVLAAENPPLEEVSKGSESDLAEPTEDPLSLSTATESHSEKITDIPEEEASEELFAAETETAKKDFSHSAPASGESKATVSHTGESASAPKSREEDSAPVESSAPLASEENNERTSESVATPPRSDISTDLAPLPRTGENVPKEVESFAPTQTEVQAQSAVSVGENKRETPTTSAPPVIEPSVTKSSSSDTVPEPEQNSPTPRPSQEREILQATTETAIKPDQETRSALSAGITEATQIAAPAETTATKPGSEPIKAKDSEAAKKIPPKAVEVKLERPKKDAELTITKRTEHNNLGPSAWLAKRKALHSATSQLRASEKITERDFESPENSSGEAARGEEEEDVLVLTHIGSSKGSQKGKDTPASKKLGSSETAEQKSLEKSKPSLGPTRERPQTQSSRQQKTPLAEVRPATSPRRQDAPSATLELPPEAAKKSPETPFCAPFGLPPVVSDRPTLGHPYSLSSARPVKKATVLPLKSPSPPKPTPKAIVDPVMRVASTSLNVRNFGNRSNSDRIPSSVESHLSEREATAPSAPVPPASSSASTGASSTVSTSRGESSPAGRSPGASAKSSATPISSGSSTPTPTAGSTGASTETAQAKKAPKKRKRKSIQS